MIRGIPGTKTDLHGVPYSLTEEFVAVYRMHPLIPDDFDFRALADDKPLQQCTLPDLEVLQVRQRLTEMSMSDVFYSFGIMHPGALTLHNFPRYLQDFHRADGEHIDLASIDVLRVRERGVPRYNEFRRLLHLNAYDTFEEMTDTPEHAEDLRRVYKDPEEVDAMIGMFAEPKPKGFGFSDTAFRIFILMASRRLETDRFFTDDFRPEVYTQEGIDWVENNSMRVAAPAALPRARAGARGRREPVRALEAHERGDDDRDRARHPQPRPREGRARPRLPDRRRRRALARGHAVRERRPARLRGDPQAREDVPRT